MLFAFRLFARLASVLCILLGVSITAGWMSSHPVLPAIAPSPTGMSPRSAAGIILGGLALGLRNLGSAPAGFRLASRACAVLLLATGLLLVVDHAVAGHDVFRSFLPNHATIGRSHAGRIAPTSVFCLTLLGASLLLSDLKGLRSRRIGDGCALAGVLIAGLPVLGHVYGVQELRALMVYRTMAPHTALCLFLLFLGCLATEPKQGLAAVITSGQPGARNSRVQLLLVVLVPFGIGLLALRGVRQGLLSTGLAMAIVVASTVVALAVRILRDGSVLDDLESRRGAAVAAQVRLTEELEQRVRERTASLALSEARLRTYFDNAPEGLLLLRVTPDDRFVVESISPSLRAMYHLGTRDLLDITLDTLFPVDPVVGMPTQIAQCLKSGRPYRTTTRREIAGQPRLLDVILAPVPAGPDGDRLIAASLRDVTDAEKREEQLRQSQKMEAVGQLTGGLAHDFNNLLTGITGSLELVRTRIAQNRIGELDRYLDIAQAAADRAAALTHRLLAFSRRQTLDPCPTDIGRVVAGMEELIRRTVGPEIAIEVTAEAGLWTALVDANQLENALLNLCINARDAMPAGGRLLISVGNVVVETITSAAAESSALVDPSGDLPPGCHVRLRVTDTGTGMTPDVMARAFDPFFTTKPIGQGTGLGLSMTYGFVRQSGGHVQIVSVPDEGTAISLYLPRHQNLPAEASLPAPVAHPGTATHGETVLVVDDEHAIRTIAVEVLEELGYRTLEAEDAATGLALLQSNARIDLLVSDVGLPNGMNGRQLAEAARLLRPGLNVLFITGYAESTVLGQGNLPPGMQVLTKPFTMERLTSRIEALLRLSRPAGSPERTEMQIGS